MKWFLILEGIQQLRGHIFAIFWPLQCAWTVFIPWAWTKTGIFWPPLLSSCYMNGPLPILVSALFLVLTKKFSPFRIFFCYFRFDISRRVYNRKSYFEFQTRLLSREEKWSRIFSNRRLLFWVVYNGLKIYLDSWNSEFLDSWNQGFHEKQRKIFSNRRLLSWAVYNGK